MLNKIINNMIYNNDRSFMKYLDSDEENFEI